MLPSVYKRPSPPPCVLCARFQPTRIAAPCLRYAMQQAAKAAKAAAERAERARRQLLLASAPHVEAASDGEGNGGARGGTGNGGGDGGGCRGSGDDDYDGPGGGNGDEDDDDDDDDDDLDEDEKAAVALGKKRAALEAANGVLRANGQPEWTMAEFEALKDGKRLEWFGKENARRRLKGEPELASVEEWEALEAEKKKEKKRAKARERGKHSRADDGEEELLLLVPLLGLIVVVHVCCDAPPPISHGCCMVVVASFLPCCLSCFPCLPPPILPPFPFACRRWAGSRAGYRPRSDVGDEPVWHAGEPPRAC